MDLQEEYKNELNIIREHGYVPIGICMLICEITYIFNTAKEAKKAYKKLEKKNALVIGWWYGKQDLLDYIPEYEKTMAKVDITWFN